MEKRVLSLKNIRNQAGQTVIEYMLILMVVVVIAIKVKNALLPTLTGAADKVGGQINKFIDETENQ